MYKKQVKMNMSELDTCVQEIQEKTLLDAEDPDYEHQYLCSGCGTLVQVDPQMIYSLEDKKMMNITKMPHSMQHYKARIPYSEEMSPGQWLTFCRKVCEMRYNRNDEEDWEISSAKKQM